MNSAEVQDAIFERGEKANAEYFTCNAWVKTLLANDAIFNCQIGNVVFEKGSRNNWHTHPAGQILIVTDGIGYYQERGKPIQTIHKGDVIKILPNVVHWHGASHDHELTHIAINPNTNYGIIDWLERVTDDESNEMKL